LVPDLIFDIGLHNGDDTAHYLERGFRVVAVDANPEMIEAGRSRFASEIAEGRVTLLNVGIAATSGTASFHVSDHTDWSSFLPEVAGRMGNGTRPLIVKTRQFAAILKEFGTPHYLKIDIEGSDALCLRALIADDLPRYVSWESGPGWDKLLDHMVALGYKSFKVIRQNDFHCLPVPYERLDPPVLPDWTKNPPLVGGFPFGSSGPFGESTHGDWHPAEMVVQAMRARSGDRHRGDHRRRAEGGQVSAAWDFSEWYDFHARLDRPTVS
jgi:FkbM family methyltransferase